MLGSLRPGKQKLDVETRGALLRGILHLRLQAQISRWSYVVMGAIFALSTPLGVAIGLGVQATYSEKSPTALGVQGVFDSVAAGARLHYCSCLAKTLDTRNMSVVRRA